MKSIMEEASSIIKAIEKGWLKAGQPKEFSVKIFEEPQRNFIGLTIKPAKIGIFFNEANPPKPETTTKTKHTQTKNQTGTTTTTIRPLNQKPKATLRSIEEKESTHKIKHTQSQDISSTKKQKEESIDSNITQLQVSQEQTRTHQQVWSEAMIQTVEQWLEDTLNIINCSDINLNLDPQHFHLKIQFNKAIFEDKNREKQLFASLATLLIQMLKAKYKRPLKGYKIILIGAS